MQWTETTILKAELFTPLCTLGSDVTQAVKILYLKSFFFFFFSQSPGLIHAFAASGFNTSGQHYTVLIKQEIQETWGKEKGA